MPRKQRFKPSRKPKPTEATESAVPQRNSGVGRENPESGTTQSGPRPLDDGPTDIESGRGSRTDGNESSRA